MKSASELRKRKYSFNFRLLLILYIVFSIFAILIEVKYRYKFFFSSSFIFFLIFFVSGVIIMFIFLSEFALGEFRVSPYLFLIPLVCITAIIGGEMISDVQAELSKNRAKEIISALENYKDANTKYPENLESLVPQYLGKIPDTSMGWFDIPFRYRRNAELSYELEFPSENEMVWCYSGPRDWWEHQQ